MIDTADRFTSDAAGDCLLDLVRFCFRSALPVGDTTWPSHLNSVSEYLSPSAVTSAQEHWMARRGLSLVMDLDSDWQLFQHSSPRVRAFMVRALDFVAESSFVLWGHVIMEVDDLEHPRALLWDQFDQDALQLMSSQIQHADPVVRDAALDAGIDLEMREAWLNVLFPLEEE
jgi:hypothetical protein